MNPDRPNPGRFYKYASANVGKIILRNQTIRWNSPLNYNDPFDCYFGMGFNFHLREYREEAISRVLAVLFGSAEPKFVTGNPIGAAFATLREIRHEVPEGEIQREVATAIDESIALFDKNIEEEAIRWRSELNRYRIFCVCEDVDNILLWSHYTKDHQGVAFQFDCLKELDVPLLVAHPVIYSDIPPEIAPATDWLDVICGTKEITDSGRMWHRLMHTKFRMWSHEREWRVITTARSYDKGLYEDTKFDPREISRMYLGCRIAPGDRDELLALAVGDFAHLEIYQAVQDPRAYNVSFTRIR